MNSQYNVSKEVLYPLRAIFENYKKMDKIEILHVDDDWQPENILEVNQDKIVMYLFPSSGNITKKNKQEIIDKLIPSVKNIYDFCSQNHSYQLDSILNYNDLDDLLTDYKYRSEDLTRNDLLVFNGKIQENIKELKNIKLKKPT